ncbi:MAG: ABC-2 type transport system ATP-binding protein [Planctomycetota bacterium]|jgi:ABC-2 type transport system ATP-binding protein
MNSPLIEMNSVTKQYADVTALQDVTWQLPQGSCVGLIGRNASGKSTLMRIVAGLVLPTSGSCMTLGSQSRDLEEQQLARIGLVQQEAELLSWLTVEQHIRYVAAFHSRWDLDLEQRLRNEFELQGKRTVVDLSPGMRQRLALLLAVCHHPELLLLDEPGSALDPIARGEAMELILERAIEDGTTVLISSHVLHDVEKIVDRVLCIDEGRILEDSTLDDLKETYAEWIVTSRDAELPDHFTEDYVLSAERSVRQARLAVRAGEAQREQFSAKHQVDVQSVGLDLEGIFPLLMKADRS